MTVLIYALCCPLSGEIRYVGKTHGRLQKRLQGHLQERQVCHKASWIKSLLATGLRPVIETIESIENSDDTDWQHVERFWISYLRFIGCRLTNMEEGGGGGKLSQATRLKLSLAHKGKTISEETRAKMSAANKGRKVSLTTRIKLREMFVGVARPEWVCQKMSAARIGVKLGPSPRRGIPNGTKGKKRGPLSPEHKAKLSAIGKGRPHSQEHRARISAALKGRIVSDETRAKLSASNKFKRQLLCQISK